MGWIDNDEFIILMDMEPEAGITSGPNVSLDGLKRLRDAGIKTGIKYVYWNKNEPSKNIFVWNDIDAWAERYHEAGMKLMLSTYTAPALWAHDDWRAMSGPGIYRPGSLSIWNPEAMEASDNFMRKVCKTYNSEDILAFCGWLTNGETVYYNEPSWYDPFAMEAYHKWAGADAKPKKEDPTTEAWLKQSYTEHMVRIQKIFADTPHKEIWTAAHLVIASYTNLYGNGCNWTEDYYVAYKNNIPGVTINVIQYTYHPHGAPYLNKIKAIIKRHGIKVWGGAEYCEGLPVSTPTALETGARGLLISPIHTFTGHKTIEPWMTEAIAKSINIFKEARS